MQNAVEDIIVLEYIQQIDYGKNTNRKDPLTYIQPLKDSLTYMNTLEASIASDCEYKVEKIIPMSLFMPKTLISLLIDMLVALSQRKNRRFSFSSTKNYWLHSGVAIQSHYKHHKLYMMLVIVFSIVDPGTAKHNENYGGNNDGDKFTSQGRNSLYHATDQIQDAVYYNIYVHIGWRSMAVSWRF
jgi:hypothetical protein